MFFPTSQSKPASSNFSFGVNDEIDLPKTKVSQQATESNFSFKLNEAIDLPKAKVSQQNLESNFSFRLNEKIDLLKSDILTDLFKTEKYLVTTHLSPPPTPLPLFSSFKFQEEGPDKGWGAIFTYVDYIPEDSIYRKLLACIPIIGIIPAFINERSLSEKITKTKDNARIIKLINIKNHYKISSIIRESLSVALVVVSVALAILGSSTGVGIAMIGGCCIAFHAYEIYKNKQLIKDLQTQAQESNGEQCEEPDIDTSQGLPNDRCMDPQSLKDEGHNEC